MPRWENERNTRDEIRKLKREAVLREAARAFGRHGYHNTSLEDIARKLEISKGTLYNYVRDKQEILFECHTEALNIGDQAVAFADAAGGTGGTRLRNCMQFYVERLINQLGACAALTEINALRPEDREVAVRRRDGFESSFRAVIEAGIGDGSLRSDLDPKLVVMTFMGAVNWIPRWYSPGGRYEADEVADKMVDTLMRGVESVHAEETARLARA
ncbi:TetR/AcrR family transcriptional regulator [Streptomyces sp. NPDC002623]